MEDSYLIVGIENIGNALGVGEGMVRCFIRYYGLPAGKMGGSGTWIISREQLKEWASKFRPIPERVNS